METMMQQIEGGRRRSTMLSALILILITTAYLVSGCTVPLTLVEPERQDAEVAADDSAATENETASVAESGEANAAADTSNNATNTDFIVTDTFEGLPVGFTADGFAFRGNPDAQIIMYEFSDYQCPFCNRHFAQTEPALNESYVESGLVKVVFIDFPLAQLHPNAPAAHEAALCVADQGAAVFWQMHHLLFETQNEWAGLPDPSAMFAGLAEQTGIDPTLYADCVSNREKAASVASTLDRARALGFSGTPSFQFVDAKTGDAYELVGAQPYARFASWLDSILAGEVPSDAAASAGTDSGQNAGGGEIPFWATDEGLSPDPDRPGYTMAGDEYRGDPDAAIVVIEYSDFQCPFCRRHATETQPVLDETFVDTGKVRWVFKHFPLTIHPQAPMAGVAAECASEQGKFWEMGEALFANVQAWSVNAPEEALTTIAGDIGLDTGVFSACLSDVEMMSRVESDFNDGRPFVQGTPTFIVMFNGEGRIIPGALPAENFVDAMNQILALAGGE